MQLKDYQNTAIKKLLTRSKELLFQSGEKKVIFKAPTGSGKTIMTAEFLKQLIDDKEIKTPLSFIWTAPRKLHTQSKEKLEKYYEDTRALECSDFENLIDKQIGENEILFLNWESINKKDKNTIVKENEKEYYLGKIVEYTKEEGREIVLIIDESHHHATSEISQDLITDIAPRLTIEVSATPVIVNPDEIVSVPLEDVKLEGMIKKSVILNPNFKNVLSGDSVNTTLADGRASVLFSDGFALWRLNGVKVPKEIVMTPKDKLSTNLVLTEKNVEVRKEIIKKIGIERVLTELNATSLEKDAMYELFRLDILDLNKKNFIYLKMLNPSTDEIHFERVHPDCNTIKKALAYRDEEVNYITPKILT